MKYREYLMITDPYEALKTIVSAEKLSLEEIEEAVSLYAKLHGITVEEMSYYPNGENVIQSTL